MVENQIFFFYCKIIHSKYLKGIFLFNICNLRLLVPKYLKLVHGAAIHICNLSWAKTAYSGVFCHILV